MKYYNIVKYLVGFQNLTIYITIIQVPKKQYMSTIIHPGILDIVTPSKYLKLNLTFDEKKITRTQK